MNDPHVPSTTGPEADRSPATTPRPSGLFGRGLLYVAVWSLQTVVAVIVSPILAYVMGPPEFGRLASAIALHQVLIVVAIFGLDQAVVLQRVEAGTAATARGLIAVGIAISAVFTVAVGLTGTLWAPALGFGGFSSLVLATILWTAPGAAVQIMLALLLTEDRLRPFAMVSALSAVGGQVFGIGLLFGVSRTADTYAWGGVISQFAAMAIGLIATRPALRGLIDWAVTWRAIKLGLPLADSCSMPASGSSYSAIWGRSRSVAIRSPTRSAMSWSCCWYSPVSLGYQDLRRYATKANGGR
jgi:O-antigen/teichoic acid export membrane protein